jgi:protein SCO1/2
MRRHLLGAAFSAALGVDAQAAAAAPAAQGLVLHRRPAPDLLLTDTMGRSISLPALCRGKVSAVQLMFAGCTSSCPIQGPVFTAVAQRVTAADMQLLSLTVNPLGDSPQALRNWLVRFGQRHCWTAGAPGVKDVNALAEFLLGAPQKKAGTHTTRPESF